MDTTPNIYAYCPYVYYSKSIAIKVNNKNLISFNVRRTKQS